MEASEGVEGGGEEFFDLGGDLFGGEGEGVAFLLEQAEVLFEAFEKEEVLLLLSEAVCVDGKSRGKVVQGASEGEFGGVMFVTGRVDGVIGVLFEDGVELGRVVDDAGEYGETEACACGEPEVGKGRGHLFLGRRWVGGGGGLKQLSHKLREVVEEVFGRCWLAQVSRLLTKSPHI